tara:strand:+ start:322 stop:534 length:213 start_codon:yes stop_codon:yes gene_type:complete
MKGQSSLFLQKPLGILDDTAAAVFQKGGYEYFSNACSLPGFYREVLFGIIIAPQFQRTLIYLPPRQPQST